jgi:hypothetical protein
VNTSGSLRDFPLADLSGESGRQLGQSITEAIQISNPSDLIDMIEDRDLRTPIAPPLTSLEEARVSFNAGTDQKGANRQLMLSDKSQTLSETLAREMSDTLTREIQVSAHTDTYTAM